MSFFALLTAFSIASGPIILPFSPWQNPYPPDAELPITNRLHFINRKRRDNPKIQPWEAK